MNFRSLKQNSKLKKIFERIPRINKFIRKIEKNIDFTSLEITRQGNSNYDAKSFQMNATETRKIITLETRRKTSSSPENSPPR